MKDNCRVDTPKNTNNRSKMNLNYPWDGLEGATLYSEVKSSNPHADQSHFRVIHSSATLGICLGNYPHVCQKKKKGKNGNDLKEPSSHSVRLLMMR